MRGSLRFLPGLFLQEISLSVDLRTCTNCIKLQSHHDLFMYDEEYADSFQRAQLPLKNCRNAQDRFSVSRCSLRRARHRVAKLPPDLSPSSSRPHQKVQFRLQVSLFQDQLRF